MKDKNLLKEINLDNLTEGPNQSVTVTVDAVDNELVSGSLQSAHTVDTITVDGVPLVDLAQINLDDIESQTVTIGKYALIGAGTVVTKDIPDFSLVVGNPGKIIGMVDKQGKRISGNKI